LSELQIGRRGLLGAALSLAAPAAATAQLPRQNPATCRGQPEIKPLQPLQIVTPKGAARFMVEYADTEQERSYGLMCRRSLAPDRGMLFDFHRPTPGVAFWMRNTLIPLDIIYIRPDGYILSIARAQPLDERPLPSGGIVRAVLEIAAGRAAQLGALPGDQIIHRIFKS
jgi:uncharacterized membrane protein (UPF0127 family)